jgi:pimeloyl-ACP methyl ester carboxylesterase
MTSVSRSIARGLVLVPMALGAQNVAGTWQGTIAEGQRPVRMIVRITSGDRGALTATLRSIDQGADFGHLFRADSVVVRGAGVTVTWTPVHVRYVGTRGADGRSIAGTWTEDGASQPLALARATSETEWRDPSPHTQRFVTVEKDARLETLDWGGTGRPVVLLAGLGNTAHVFDQFAQKLTSEYHVYGITRRGFGESSAPESGYLADSLAGDVLAVLDSLGIRRPVLIGHSIAGQEMSSIATHHADRVAGLVYLEAGYQFAFYDSGEVHVQLSLRDTQRTLAKLADPAVAMPVKERGAMIDELLQTSLPLLERDLRAYRETLARVRDQSAALPAADNDPSRRRVLLGTQRYTDIRVPVLALFALPQETPPAMARDSVLQARADSISLANSGPHVNAFERGIPGSRVVRVAHANHYIFRSNEAEVLREIRAFVAGLP